MYEGNMDKAKRGWVQRWEAGMGGLGVCGGGAIETNVLEQQLKKIKRKTL